MAGVSVDVPAGRTRRKRPKGVLALVVLGILQGVLLVLVAVAAAVLLGRIDEVDLEGIDSPGLVGYTVVAGGLGIANLVLAVGLLRGSPLARSVTGGVAVAQVALATYAFTTLDDIRGGAVWSLVFPMGVLWLLYGSDAVEEFFRR